MMGSRRIVWTRYGYLGLSGFFALLVLVQVYIAGMVVFVAPSNWTLHATFVHIFEPLLLPLFACAFLGQLPRSLKIASVALFLLVSVQYATASLFGSMVAAIHPVNAVVIFSVAVLATNRTWSIISELPDETRWKMVARR